MSERSTSELYVPLPRKLVAIINIGGHIIISIGFLTRGPPIDE